MIITKNQALDLLNKRNARIECVVTETDGREYLCLSNLAEQRTDHVAIGDGGLPYRTINPHGEQAVDEFISRAARDVAAQVMSAWYAEAEQAANDAAPGEAIVIEIDSARSVTGNPQTLTLDDSCFDWEWECVE